MKKVKLYFLIFVKQKTVYHSIRSNHYCKFADSYSP